MFAYTWILRFCSWLILISYTTNFSFPQWFLKAMNEPNPSRGFGPRLGLRFFKAQAPSRARTSPVQTLLLTTPDVHSLMKSPSGLHATRGWTHYPENEVAFRPQASWSREEGNHVVWVNFIILYGHHVGVHVRFVFPGFPNFKQSLPIFPWWSTRVRTSIILLHGEPLRVDFSFQDFIDYGITWPGCICVSRSTCHSLDSSCARPAIRW
jgi:hypothetical protein